MLGLLRKYAQPIGVLLSISDPGKALKWRIRNEHPSRLPGQTVQTLAAIAAKGYSATSELKGKTQAIAVVWAEIWTGEADKQKAP